MARIKDLTGKVFGKLTVIKQDGFYIKTDHGRTSMWLCECTCGQTTRVIGANLTRGATKSCGCLAKQASSERSRLALGESSFNSLYNTYKYRARKRGLIFNIPKERFRGLTQQSCYYCDSPPSREHQTTESYGKYLFNGVDRVDNDKGYVEGNVVPCCKHCNVAKASLATEEFFDMVKKIYEKHLRSE